METRPDSQSQLFPERNRRTRALERQALKNRRSQHSDCPILIEPAESSKQSIFIATPRLCGFESFRPMARSAVHPPFSGPRTGCVPTGTI